MDRYFRILIFLIIILHLVTIFLPSFEIDMNVWKAWTQRLLTLGVTGFYASDYFSDYPPVYLYYLYIIGALFNFFFGMQSLFTQSFDIFFKFFSLLFNLSSAFIIYQIVRKHSSKFALPASFIFLANPVLLFDASVWGQNDGIMIFLCLLSSYLLFNLKQAYIWAIVFSLAILFKFQSLALLPIFGVFLLSNFKIRSVILTSVLLISFSLLLSLPFFGLNNLIPGLLDLFSKSSSTYPYASLYAFNIWAFDGFWTSDSRVFLSVTLQTWGVILYLSALVPILFKLFKTSNPLNYYLAGGLSFLAFFILLTRMHERYIVPSLAFLTIALLVNNFKHNLITYSILSLISFLNLFYVYIYYNVVYNNPESANLIYKVVSENYLYLAFVNILIFGYLLAAFLKTKNGN